MMRHVPRFVVAHMLVLAALTLSSCLNPQTSPFLVTPLPDNGEPTPPSEPTAPSEPTPSEEMLGDIPFENMQHYPSPDGQWTAHVGESTGRVTLEDAGGTIYPVFEPVSTIGAVEWSPDSQMLVVAQHAWSPEAEGAVTDTEQPLQLWLVEVNEQGPEPPQLLFQSPVEPTNGSYPPEQIEFGAWSPDSRQLPFWIGPVGSSIRSDGLAFWMADLEAGSSTPLAEMALLNPYYQSWSPDSSALAFVAGGNRSAQVNKWLSLYDVASQQVTTVVSATEQVPGIVAWSPDGQWIAYAAVPAEQTGPEWEGLMTFDNPAIDGRRIYLLDPTTGESRRFNDVEAFQDAPLWSDDGTTLYYVERHDDTLVLMAADVATGVAEMVAGSEHPLPEMVGYYGQGEWEEYWSAVEE